MRTRILGLIIAVVIGIASAYSLEKTYTIEPQFSHQTKPSDFPLLMVVSLFHLEDLCVGYLWLQFDVDSLGAVANYHRLYGILDLITTIKPTEFHAWGLATYMRYKQWMHLGYRERAREALDELHTAQDRFPDVARGWYELAYMYGFVLKETQRAEEYARKAYELHDNKENELIYQTMRKVNARRFGGTLFEQ